MECIMTYTSTSSVIERVILYSPPTRELSHPLNHTAHAGKCHNT